MALAMARERIKWSNFRNAPHFRAGGPNLSMKPAGVSLGLRGEGFGQKGRAVLFINARPPRHALGPAEWSGLMRAKWNTLCPLCRTRIRAELKLSLSISRPLPSPLPVPVPVVSSRLVSSFLSTEAKYSARAISSRRSPARRVAGNQWCNGVLPNSRIKRSN